MGDSQFHQLTKMVELTTTSTLVIQYFVGEGHTDIANFIQIPLDNWIYNKFFNKKWAKPAFFSESKCRTNGKIMVFNLHKFEPPQIMQPSFTFLTALLHTLHLLYLVSKFYLQFQLCQFHCYLKRTSLPSYCQKLLFSSPPPLLSKLQRGWSVI